MAEYCNGFSPICPADTSAYANGPCQLNSEYGVCYTGGICMTRNVACLIMSQNLNMNLVYSDSCDTSHSCSIICSDGTTCYNFTELGYTSYYNPGQTCGLKYNQFCQTNGVCSSTNNSTATPQNSTANRINWF